MTLASAPVVVGGLALANDLSSVNAVELRTGKVRWRVESPLTLSQLGHTIAASEKVTAVLFSTLSINGQSALGGDTAGCLALRTSDGKQLWALREKPRSIPAMPSPYAPPSASPPDIAGGSGSQMPETWGVAVRDNRVFLSGGGRVRAYRTDAG
ncbi:hypothetical protein [Streptomyces sp. TS71-3]|uniref:hypothetical protein n=1 Tax=Streptomyces sp. TS71-3 TaxID=2733862 RepID=UPI001B1B2192|nr:hypothetical protein [Streptomyces sp. TS71-3]GHJ41808.1 hypothetical protein Sm713_74170 [Streptomyces sp. TS71-3]